MQHKHNGAKFICFSVRLQPFVLRLQHLPPPHLVVVVMQFYFVFIYFDFLLETNWKHSKTVRRVLCMFGQIAETNSLENNTKLRQQIEQFSVNLQ